MNNQGLVKCDLCNGSGKERERYSSIKRPGERKMECCCTMLSNECVFPDAKPNCRIIVRRNSPFSCIRCRGTGKITWIQKVFSIYG